MEPGYLHINWNTIPGLYNQKQHLRTLVIEKKEWDHLSDPAQLAHFWEPTQNPEDFHQTLALALCWTPFHDSPNADRKKEYVMFVAAVSVPFRLLQMNSGTVRTKQPILSYWSGFTGSPCCSQIFTMTGTGTILHSCTIPVKGITLGTRRYFSEHYYIMLTPPGKGHLLKQNFRRHTWTGRWTTL